MRATDRRHDGEGADRTFRFERQPEGVLSVHGDVDEATADSLRAALEDTGLAAVDLGAVTFMDSSGLRVLVDDRRRRAASGELLELRHASPTVRRLFELVGLTAWLAPCDGGSREQRPSLQP